MDRLTTMRVFVRAVELGSFAAAADDLDLSGPMVGKHVRSLEERLGARLLNRTTRRQSLTELGRAYYERCRVVLAEAEAADALVIEDGADLRGRLRVSMPALLGRHCIAPVLLAFARQYPRLELELSLNDRLGDLLEEEVDIAVRTGGLASRGDLAARRLARQTMTLFAAPAYIEKHGAPGSPEALANHETIAYCHRGVSRPWLFPSGDGAPQVITPRARLRADDMDVLAQMAAQALGIAWLPTWLAAPRVARGELRPLLPDQSFPYDVHAVWLQTPYLPRKVRAAIDLLVAEIPAYVA
jgi:DNA-binding transcriptional LysR family regulator